MMTEEEHKAHPHFHSCTQETNIALIQEYIRETKEDVNESKQSLKRIEKKLNNGMSTQVELNKAAIIRVWWFMGIAGLGAIISKIFFGG